MENKLKIRLVLVGLIITTLSSCGLFEKDKEEEKPDEVKIKINKLICAENERWVPVKYKINGKDTLLPIFFARNRYINYDQFNYFYSWLSFKSEKNIVTTHSFLFNNQFNYKPSPPSTFEDFYKSDSFDVYFEFKQQGMYFIEKGNDRLYLPYLQSSYYIILDPTRTYTLKANSDTIEYEFQSYKMIERSFFYESKITDTITIKYVKQKLDYLRK